MSLSPLWLQGKLVVLEPLHPDHIDGLTEASMTDRDSFSFTLVPHDREAVVRYMDAALSQQAGGHALVWTARRTSDSKIVGSTRFWDLHRFDRHEWPPGSGSDTELDEAHPPTVGEIGSTWLSREAQGTGVNTEMKLLQLTHAFETGGMLRVTLKTDARNERSRAAITVLGATFEGVRRAHTLATDGTVRDSAYYSILLAEWPTVCHRILHRLQ